MKGKWIFIGKGLLIAVTYCLAYMAAWFSSLDQWLLPAGVRAGAALLLPRRWLWAWIVGDVAVMLLMRVPRAAFDGTLWAYLTPFLLGPMAGAVPLLSRRWLRTRDRQAAWLPAVAAATAVWGWFCNLVLSTIATSPNAFANAEMALKFSVGSFLGILAVLLPALLWLNRPARPTFGAPLRDGLLAGILVLALQFAVTRAAALDPAIRMGMLMLMLAPAVPLTFSHGWHGAATGLVAANLGIGLTLPDFQQEGGFDALTFVGQQGLCLASAGLLALGSAISRHRAAAEAATALERAAQAMSESGLRWTERSARENLLLMARLQAHLDRGRHHFVEWLRTHGHAAAALDLNSQSMAHRTTFEAHATALYPIQLEHDGLYAVLAGEAFRQYWVGGDTPVRYDFRGAPRALSLDLQLSAYRAVCQCLVILHERAPSAYRIRARVWRRGQSTGIVLSVSATSTAGTRLSSLAADECSDLMHRARTHGGAAKLHHHAHRLCVLLSEQIPPLSGPPAPRSPNRHRTSPAGA